VRIDGVSRLRLKRDSWLSAGRLSRETLTGWLWKRLRRASSMVWKRDEFWYKVPTSKTAIVSGPMLWRKHHDEFGSTFHLNFM
jgi:hypothetical protein